MHSWHIDLDMPQWILSLTCLLIELKERGMIWEGQELVSGKSNSKFLVTSFSPENTQWEEDEPLLPSTSDIIVYFGRCLSNSASQSTCLKTLLALRIMVFKVIIISKRNIYIFSIDSYGWIMPVLAKPIICKHGQIKGATSINKTSWAWIKINILILLVI